MPELHTMFELEHCPHCGINRPSLYLQNNFETHNHKGDRRRVWFIYICANCGGVVSAAANKPGQLAQEHYPQSRAVDDALPEKAKAYLQQAINSLHAPAGSIMLSASCVDSMLKEKGYISGSLYKRIDQASSDHLITSEMASWAHEVRLDANEQRHSDNEDGLPSEADAEKAVEFTLALAEILFVLPKRVRRGIEETGNGT